tara:strand:- start:635 stop:925 length:291 start_codon:yes stop_codon:yes gene_type:complete
VQILNELNIEYEVIEYIKKPLTVKELKELSRLLNLPPIEFVRKGDKSIKVNIDKFSSESLLIEMSKNPRIIERPIVVYDNKAIIARPPEKIYDFLG